MATQYGADFEVCIEMRFGKSMSSGLSGSNLLDASNVEQLNIGGGQLERDFEVESEKAGPVIQLIGRYSF